MSVLGKVLIVLNLLAAGAFAYLTLENYKVRNEIAFVAFKNEVLLRGFPVEKSEDKGDDVSFPWKVSENNFITALNKETLKRLSPDGGPEFGGTTTASLTDEIERLKGVVTTAVNGLSGQAKLDKIKLLLLNLSRGGAERDGVIALFDAQTPAKYGYARRDLPFVARTSSQVAALKALVEIAELGDPATITPEATRTARIAGAREGVKRFALGEVPFGSGTTDNTSANFTTLRNAIDDLSKGRGSKDAVTAAATADAAGFGHIADLLTNPVDSLANIAKAAESVLAFTTGKAITPSETSSLTHIVALIAPGAGADLAKSIDSAASDLLVSKFDDAALPAATKENTKGYPSDEKARRIAHVMYHIDANKYATPAERQAWHARVVAMVGLNEYVRVAEAQASEYTEAAQRLIAVIANEEGAFTEQYQAQVQRCLFLYSQVLALEAQLEGQNAILKENKKLYEERVTERDALKVSLDKAREDARVGLERLQVKQKDLFSIQKDLRDAQRALLQLERDLQRLELNRK
jgi:hypothetical protein